MNQEHYAKMVAGLRRQRDYIMNYGRYMHETYPAKTIPPEIFEKIMVPVPLPAAMMLFGLGALVVMDDMDKRPDARAQGGDSDVNPTAP